MLWINNNRLNLFYNCHEMVKKLESIKYIIWVAIKYFAELGTRW